MLVDLGCHLLDLAFDLFGYDGTYRVWDLRSLESGTFDYGVVASADRRIVLEFANVMWRNTFSIDVFGELGSLHLQGLLKWGPARLTCRQRVFPSGVPVETVHEDKGEDISWAADLDEFEGRVHAGVTSLESDWRISRSISSLLADHRVEQPGLA